MNVLFHSNQLGLRGTEIALYDYAHYNETILGNKSYIAAPETGLLTSLDKFKNRFDVILYKSGQNLKNRCVELGIDVAYFIKAGHNDGIMLDGVKSVIHTVFQVNRPHGDVYAYVSEWLSDKMTGGQAPWVPHIVSLHDQAKTDEDFRDYLNIPKEALVFGYYGGETSFNIPEIRQAVDTISKQNPNIYFMFMNSYKFVEDRPNVFFFSGTTDLEQKVRFINTCDACIHAREGGESFGLTLGEFATAGKPCIVSTPKEGEDSAHVNQLGDSAIFYQGAEDFSSKIYTFEEIRNSKPNWEGYRGFTPTKVMKRFEEVFLK